MSAELMQLINPRRLMENKHTFEPGDMVKTLTGHTGMVVQPEAFAGIMKRLKEGRKPGYHFAPGCCHNPDYVTRIPVLFEDGTWNVMRAMNIKKAGNPPKEDRARILAFLMPDGGSEGPV